MPSIGEAYGAVAMGQARLEKVICHTNVPGDALFQRYNRCPWRVTRASSSSFSAEENASKSKFPKYPDLDRWELLEKMGDGAFSNVYRARDLQGEHGEVAIKVVRKYEMNRMQVSCINLFVIFFSLLLLLS